jgi:hypothetical protein
VPPFVVPNHKEKLMQDNKPIVDPEGLQDVEVGSMPPEILRLLSGIRRSPEDHYLETMQAVKDGHDLNDDEAHVVLESVVGMVETAHDIAPMVTSNVDEGDVVKLLAASQCSRIQLMAYEAAIRSASGVKASTVNEEVVNALGSLVGISQDVLDGERYPTDTPTSIAAVTAIRDSLQRSLEDLTAKTV